MNNQLIVQGMLYTIIAALTPVVTMLSSDRPLDRRAVLAVIVAAIVAGATALKAYLSTTYADSPESETPGRSARLARGKTK